jgi:hypothetical protein
MSTKEILYACFYLIFFALAIWAGIKTGFTDSHTPSLPFAIEFFTLPIGIIFFIVDLRRYHPITLKKSSIHVIGLIANVCVMGYVLILAF